MPSHPPDPLLPQGEKGEFGRPEAQNKRRNAGASKKPPCKEWGILIPGTRDGRQGVPEKLNLQEALRQPAGLSSAIPLLFMELFAPGVTHAHGARASRPRRVSEGKMLSLPEEI